MWMLLTAVATASLLSSMHCVGMCGPLAIWAAGAGDAKRPANSKLLLAVVAYHGGRLITYISMGILVGLIGQAIDYGGQALGFQLVAARLVGLVMITGGLFRLWQLTRSTSPQVRSSKPSFVASTLVRLRPFVLQLPLAVRGLVVGMLTTLLPCGLLYLFALFAAGTGSWQMAATTMLAFWVGTVPALVGLVSGMGWAATRFRTAIPILAALFMVLGGSFTATGRGFAKLESLTEIRLPNHPNVAATVASDESDSDAAQLQSELQDLISAPLPCCPYCATGE
ncbi:MAG: sulfite exporter TauE/SafE family protein [Planctomycetales bacterium]|nr:sulfite exporter TauE/SafE family protein [Planctomycetales bacterium]